MRKVGFALALMSTVSMTVVPSVPAFASNPSSPTNRQTVQSPLVAAITTDQLGALAKSNPRLHKKIVAYNSGSPILVTPSEGRTLRALNKQTLASVKGGSFAAVLLAFLATPVGLIVVTYAIEAISGKASNPTATNGFICFFSRLVGADSPACYTIEVRPTPKPPGA